jgi:hypothetical protein
MQSTYPSLSVKAAAESLGKPIEKRMNTLHRQKYPTAGDGIFPLQYYQQAVRFMRLYYAQGASVIPDARAKFQSFSQESKRENSNRALDSFLDSEFSKLPLVPVSNGRVLAMVEGVAVKLSAHMKAIWDDQAHYFYINCCNHQYNPEHARRTLEIGHHVLTANGAAVKPGQMHFVDLFTKNMTTLKSVRASTLDLLRDDAKGIHSVWKDL